MPEQLDFIDNIGIEEVTPEIDVTTLGLPLEGDLKHLRNYTLVTDPTSPEINNVLNQIDREPEFAIDTETTGLDRMRDTVAGISISTSGQDWYFTRGAEKALMPLLTEIANKGDKLVMGHNLKFDMHMTRNYGFRPPKAFDTMIAQALVDENQSLKLKHFGWKVGVDDNLPTYEDILKAMKKPLGVKKMDDVSIHDIPLEIIGPYAAGDTRLTYMLGQVSKHELAKEGMTDIYWDIEMPFMYVLLDMEQRGMYLDPVQMSRLQAEYEQAQEDAKQRWLKITGGVSPTSTKQVSKYLYETMGYPVQKYTSSKNRKNKDAEPNPSVDITALRRLLYGGFDNSGAIQALIDFRKYDKLLGTYLLSWQEMMFNGRLYGSFNQTGTVTWRLSASDPNLQNVPGKGEEGEALRSLFSVEDPDNDEVLVDDYSQIELRLLAHYSRDPNLLQVFETGGDPHQMTADLINSAGFHITRKNAKTVNFGWAYGVGPRGLADQIEQADNPRPSEKETRAWLDGFAKAYPTAVAWKAKVLQYCRDLGYVKTLDGHKRHLPDIKSYDRALAGAAERQAVNSIIQGSAASVLKRAMIRINRFLPFYDAKWDAQVHDEIVLDGPKKAMPELKMAVEREMLEAGASFNLRVKLEAQANSGPNWYAAK